MFNASTILNYVSVIQTYSQDQDEGPTTLLLTSSLRGIRVRYIPTVVHNTSARIWMREKKARISYGTFFFALRLMFLRTSGGSMGK